MNITFVGGGNMGSAMIGGMLAQGYRPHQIRVVERSAENRQRLEEQFGVATHATPEDAMAGSQAVILAVKPQQIFEVAKALRPLLTDQLVVSIAAGIRTADLSRWLGGYANIVRVMPNTPALIRAGVSGLYAMAAVGDADKQTADALLGAVGATLWFADEADLDAVTALSGSGPAYVFYFLEAMQAAGLTLGLSAQAARTLSLHTLVGAARLAAESGEDPAVLRARVTSKGGTTERALLAMERAEVKGHIIAAIHAAADRSRELGEQYGKVG